MKNISIIRHGDRDSRLVNTREHAVIIGQKLIRIGRMLQNPELSTLVPKRYFNRTDERNSVFLCMVMGDNGKHFEVAALIEQLTDDDKFDVADIEVPR